MTWIILIASPLLFAIGILIRDANMDPLSTKLGVMMAYFGVLLYIGFVLVNGFLTLTQ